MQPFLTSNKLATLEHTIPTYLIHKSKLTEAKKDGVINPQIYNFNKF